MTTPPFALPIRGGLALGVGVDLVEVARIGRLRERQGQRFLDRIYTPQEQAYCLGMRRPDPHLAARFAAKEAVSKAFSTGIGAYLSWTSIGVRRGQRGEPLVVLDSKGRALLERLGGRDVALSLSHTDAHAIAFAALVGGDIPSPPETAP